MPSGGGGERGGVGLQGRSELVIIKSRPKLYLYLHILQDLSNTLWAMGFTT
jgi:hypothetical protein